VSWRAAARRDYPALLSFILADEKRCVPLSARFKGKDRGTMVYVNDGANGGIGDCFLFSAHGLFLPLFRSVDRRPGELERVLLGLRPPVHSIMGVAGWVAEAESLLPLPPTTRVQYYLMALEKSRYRAPRSRSSGITIRPAAAADAAPLFPLQKSYEMEEVVLNPALFSDSQCDRLLRKSLREEVIYLAERDGKPVAKAGTNARGYGVDQIGGVYTAPAERGRGTATAVMAALLEHIFQEKHGACLFVKKTNGAALALYKRLGFLIVDEYVINYYGV
jgi:predicted GNAT family acetyltransferase